MCAYSRGRHEHGQNFLVDDRVIGAILDLVRGTSGPIIEIGPGGGALTIPLAALGRPLTAVEIDGRLADRLRRHPQLRSAELVHGDFLRYRLPHSGHVIVGNLPFHQTTAVLRHLLHAPGWTEAVLMTQWEVARRRAAVGGATMMTAQWWPWFEFELHDRVPASSFVPRPGVDAGVIKITRRRTPLLDVTARRPYKAFVHDAFTGCGRGIEGILVNLAGRERRMVVRAALVRRGITRHALPKDLSDEDWAALFSELGRPAAR